MSSKDNICSRILTPKQVGPICWFMSTFVAMFYSQRSRKILLKASNYWDTKKRLFELLNDILHNKYLKKKGEGYDNFSDNTFIELLSLLYREKKESFPFNPKHKKMLNAFLPQLYIGNLYTILGIDYKMFDYSTKNFKLTYSYLNKDYDDLRIFKIKGETIIDEIKDVEGISKLPKYEEDDNTTPPILIVRVYAYDIPIYDSVLSNNIVPVTSKNSNIGYRRANVIYNEQKYTLDSVVLSNNNPENNNGHVISGITCQGNRYIYNGWIRESLDPAMANERITRDIPCNLMPYNWNLMFDNDICLNTKDCTADILKRKEEGKFCFNFSDGVRILIYVKTTSNEGSKSPKGKQKTPDMEPPPSYEEAIGYSTKLPLPSLSGGRANTTRISKRKELKVQKNIRNTISTNFSKNCPEGKVLNPKTGRFILIKNAINKNGIKPKSPNRCQEGKVLNPKTGRFIFIRNNK
jgi:hypothetical protein